MKFINVSSAKNLIPGKTVFIELANGERKEAKLISKTEDETGQKFVFEIPAYFNKDKPSINPVLTSDVVKVCVLKFGNGNIA